MDMGMTQTLRNRDRSFLSLLSAVLKLLILRRKLKQNGLKSKKHERI